MKLDDISIVGHTHIMCANATNRIEFYLVGDKKGKIESNKRCNLKFMHYNKTI